MLALLVEVLQEGLFLLGLVTILLPRIPVEQVHLITEMNQGKANAQAEKETLDLFYLNADGGERANKQL